MIRRNVYKGRVTTTSGYAVLAHPRQLHWKRRVPLAPAIPVAFSGRLNCIYASRQSSRFSAAPGKSNGRGFAPSFSSHVRWGERGAPGAARLGSSALGLSGYAEAPITGKKISFQLASFGKHQPNRRRRMVEQHPLGRGYGRQQQARHLLPSRSRYALPSTEPHNHLCSSRAAQRQRPSK
jgi:hypothetical protein